jgi:hypothetical protein
MPLSFPTAPAPRLLVLTALVTLLPALASAQPARPQNPPDISGEWSLANNEYDTTAQPPLGDYTGIAFNAAGVMRSETTAESIFGTPEYQCRPHSSPHQWRGLGGARILKEQDPLTREVRVYHIQFMRSLDRPIYMDGRPHPPEWAPHTWAGFSTGRWEGDMLTIKTTHLKEGYVRRNGLPRSDTATLTEHWMLHNDVLTVATIVYDPVYLTEPFIRTTDYELDLHQQNPPYPCEVVEEVDRPKGSVPHKLPSETNFDTDFATRCGIPIAAAKGGAETMYPEYKSTLPATPATCVAAPR